MTGEPGRTNCGRARCRAGHTADVADDLLEIRPHVPVVLDRWVTFATGFRVFFLAGAAAALLPVALWIDVYGVGVLPAIPWPAAAWHGHEMVYGFAAAVVIGFLTTAVPKWTSTAAASGRPLVFLFLAWLSARLAMLAAAVLPPEFVLASSLSVYPLVLWIIGRPVFGTANRRNYGFPVLLLLLAVGDTLAHVPQLGGDIAWRYHGLRLGLYVLVMMVVLVGGRIVPVFTNAAMQRDGRAPVIGTPPRWESIIPVVAAAACVAQLSQAPMGLAVPLLAGATALLSIRVVRWRPWVARGNPLLWILHAGHAWIPVGFLCLLLSRMGVGMAEATALHAFGAGAVGCMILAMISRVALGHTGRPLVLPAGMTAAFLVVVLAALLRVLGPALAPAYTGPLVIAASVAWIAGFGAYIVRYAGLLMRPRVDGRPG